MDNARLAAAKTAYRTACDESSRKYQADHDRTAFFARNNAASKQYLAAERDVYAAADAFLTSQARQDHRYDEF